MNRSRTDVTLESLWASGFAPHCVTSRGQRDSQDRKVLSERGTIQLRVGQ